MNLFLITSAHEKTWKFDRPVLFLGEWCRLFNRKDTWEKMDAKVAEPYGLGKLRETDQRYIETLKNQILEELTASLNRYHQTQHDSRYWNILLGHWLQRYVAVTFNRYKTIEQALAKYSITETVCFHDDEYNLVNENSYEFIWATNDDTWNHFLFSKVLHFFNKKEIKAEYISKGGDTSFTRRNLVNAQTNSNKKSFNQILKSFAPKLMRDHDAFIINSYLPLKSEILLQVELGQFPQKWKSPPLEKISYDKEKRKAFHLSSEGHSGYESFARNCLIELLPICFLEGYSSLISQVSHLPWPHQPKFIFTSNNFDTDEVFKAWAGSKVEQGVAYFTGQHGNNYGTHIINGTANWPERASSDKFFTWGWNEGPNDPRNIPAFLFKTLDRTTKSDPKGGLLLVEQPIINRVLTYDVFFEMQQYQDEQYQFIESLSPKILPEVTVRLHHTTKYLAWYEEERWKERNFNIKLETGIIPLAQLIGQNRIVVHTYDSTGILENLVLNLPMICFWKNGFDHLLPQAKPYYELLKEAGIFAETPQKAAALIEKYWDNVDEWWMSPKVQNARIVFCQQYARTDQHPVKTLKKLLLTNSTYKE